MTESTYDAMEDAIVEHIKSSDADGIMVTGWLIVASVSSLEHDSTNSDGYVMLSSEGLPHHTQIGLLNVALDDKRSMAMLNAMSSYAINMNDEDEDE